jgi:AcrR family transcriptional regulator
MAAESLVREQGADSVSLRGIARATGVSHAAPYHHFVDLEDLLAAVAASGFTSLRQLMLERADKATGTDPRGRLQEAGVAYVTFATENPELYRLMFSGRLRGSGDHPDLDRASDEAYRALGELLAQTVETEATESETTRLVSAARASWALVHGLSTLLIDGRLDLESDRPEDVRALVQEVTTVLGQGLRNL